jgi:hypothetical protein
LSAKIVKIKNSQNGTLIGIRGNISVLGSQEKSGPGKFAAQKIFKREKNRA